MVQSYKASVHTLRYQAWDPELEEDVTKPVSVEETSEGEAHVSMVTIGQKSFTTSPRPVKTMTFFSQLSPQSTSLSHASISCPILLFCTSKKPSYGRQMACKQRFPCMYVLTHGVNSAHTWSADTELYQMHKHAAQLDTRCAAKVAIRTQSCSTLSERRCIYLPGISGVSVSLHAYPESGTA